MKKVILLTLLAVLFACEKDDTNENGELKSLANTEWTGTMPDYYDGTVVVKGISATQATLTAGATTITFSYNFNETLKTGTLTAEGETFVFEIKGNSLTLTDPYGDKYNFTRTK